MSMWQFNAAIKGYIKANSASDPKKFSSEEERDDMFNWLMSQEISEVKILSSKVYIFDGSNFNLERVVSFKTED